MILNMILGFVAGVFIGFAVSGVLLGLNELREWEEEVLKEADE